MPSRTQVTPWLLLGGSMALAASCSSASDTQEVPVGEAEAAIVPTTEGPTPSPYNQSFTAFESGHVRPLALTPDKKYLLATNTPDAKLEVYKVKNNGLDHVASVPVGLEPVAVAARNNGEAWVVNHLSDSVSIVDLDGHKSRVVRTLLVGDEPRDVVFAGTNEKRAFITTAHRGQNSPIDPELATPGVGRNDVWVFDADDCHSPSFGGEPETILTFFSDTPRALAVTPDKKKVYVAAFNSGNATASTFVGNFSGIGNPLPPYAPSSQLPVNANVNAHGEEQPLTSVIVKYDGEHWRDENGGIRDNEMMFTMPDRDVFAIDADADPPQALEGPSDVYSGVGTILFNMIVNPVNGKVYVTNLESNNQQRFEGSNTFAGDQTHPAPSVRGRIAFSRVTVLDQAGNVTPRHLNKHINYDTCCAPIPNNENARSVAFPIGMEITKNGKTLYVAAVGSSEVAVYDTTQLENDSFVPNTANQIPVSGGGPTGLALDEGKKRLYVLTRFDNAIKIIDTQTKAQIGSASMYNPEPAHIVQGRRFLYDASLSSSHGDSACFSCHIFGDMDHIGWDLGVPDDANVPDPNVYQNNSFRKFFASMKGVMTTQSLRGMDNQGPMHWRGDRNGSLDEPSAQPNSGHFNERLAFKKFNAAFPGLLGRNAELTNAQMEAFTSFILEVMYPPNPIRNLDNSLTERQQLGFDIFFGPKTFFDPFVDGDPDGAGTAACGDCHALDPNANAGFTTKPGFFGSNNLSAEVAGLQNVKNPHLRNLYQKVGKFGFPFSPIWLPSPGAGEHQGEQIRGWGFAHDGSFDTTKTFSFAPNFGIGLADPNEPLTIFPPFANVQINNPEGISSVTPEGLAIHEALDDYMMVFETNFAPIVGQQVTIRDDNHPAFAHQRLDLLIERATHGECDLIAHGGKKDEGYLYKNGMFLRNKAGKPALSDDDLRDLADKDEPLTYTCVPRGNGRRLAIDRDLDGTLDGNE